MHRLTVVSMVVSLMLAGCAADRSTPNLPRETLPGTAAGSTASSQPPQMSPPTTVEVPDGDVATVTQVFDGDSFQVTLAGRVEEVRMIGINAPEGDECFGDQARTALRGLIDDAEVTLVAAGEDDTDRFGRLLRFVYIDGIFVNHEMARSGAAVVFQGGQPLEAEMKALENEAFDAGRGMWEIGACGDQMATDILILTVEYDPPGRDFENKEEEYAGIGNAGTATVDLSGWVLRDETSQHRFVFPDGFTLDPDDVVRVRVGCGSNDANDLYWCSNDAVWSNGGDTALLLDGNGNVVDRYVYEGDF